MAENGVTTKADGVLHTMATLDFGKGTNCKVSHSTIDRATAAAKQLQIKTNVNQILGLHQSSPVNKARYHHVDQYLTHRRHLKVH